jgi:sugar phosphate isomerase/epimerase
MFGFDCASLQEWQADGKPLARLAQHLRDAGIAAGPLAACAILDGSKETLELLHAAADVAEALGVRVLQVNVDGATPDARVAAVAAACERVSAIGPYRLAIEYLPFIGLATLAESLSIVAEVGEDKVGVLVDIWHHSHDPDGWTTLATAPLSAIAYIEMDDALPPIGTDQMLETVERRTYPGEGIFETRRFAGMLRGRGYEGPVSVEILNRSLLREPIAVFAEKALQSTRHVFL